MNGIVDTRAHYRGKYCPAFFEKLPIQAYASRVKGGLVADLISPSGGGVLVELCGSWRRH